MAINIRGRPPINSFTNLIRFIGNDEEQRHFGRLLVLAAGPAAAFNQRVHVALGGACVPLSAGHAVLLPGRGHLSRHLHGSHRKDHQQHSKGENEWA